MASGLLRNPCTDRWPQAGGNAAQSYGHLALADTPSRLFSVNVEGASQRRRLGASPVIGDGMMFVVGGDGALTAFDAQTGARRWGYNPGVANNLKPSAFGGGASYDNGKIYMTDGVGDVVALNASDAVLCKDPAPRLTPMAEQQKSRALTSRRP